MHPKETSSDYDSSDGAHPQDSSQTSPEPPKTKVDEAQEILPKGTSFDDHDTLPSPKEKIGQQKK